MEFSRFWFDDAPEGNLLTSKPRDDPRPSGAQKFKIGGYPSHIGGKCELPCSMRPDRLNLLATGEPKASTHASCLYAHFIHPSVFFRADKLQPQSAVSPPSYRPRRPLNEIMSPRPPRGRRPKAWTHQQKRKLVRLYTLTTLSNAEILAVLGEDGFSPRFVLLSMLFVLTANPND
jgi:hypothetical protein